MSGIVKVVKANKQTKKQKINMAQEATGPREKLTTVVKWACYQISF